MKKVLLFAILSIGLVFASCKKEEIKPSGVVVKEQMSVFDKDIIEVSNNEITGNLGSSNLEYSIQCWYYLTDKWILIPNVSNATGANITTDNTGNVKIVLNMAPIDPAVKVRVIIK